MHELQLHMKGNDMKTKTKKVGNELRPEYDFDYSKAIRGKYYNRLIKEGANIIILDPDLSKSFSDSIAVNEALRTLLSLTRTKQRLTNR